jgi:uncharacterized protein YkwD
LEQHDILQGVLVLMIKTRFTRRIIILGLLVSVLLTACSTVEAAFSTPTPLPLGDYIYYMVQPGDTASQIAKQFRLTIEQLIALNTDRYPAFARDPSLLQPGWQLKVPSKSASAAVRATAEAMQPSFDMTEATQRTIDEVNAARAKQAMSPLKTDPTLMRIARERSTDMIGRDYFSHLDPDTHQQPVLRYLQATNYVYRYAGENIAEIRNGVNWVPSWLSVAARYTPSQLAAQFVTDWMNSPEHRDNIENTHYRKTGLAIGVSHDGQRIVATQVFSD